MTPLCLHNVAVTTWQVTVHKDCKIKIPVMQPITGTTLSMSRSQDTLIRAIPHCSQLPSIWERPTCPRDEDIDRDDIFPVMCGARLLYYLRMRLQCSEGMSKAAVLGIAVLSVGVILFSRSRNSAKRAKKVINYRRVNQREGEEERVNVLVT